VLTFVPDHVFIPVPSTVKTVSEAVADKLLVIINT
jgi:hypothetical protein